VEALTLDPLELKSLARKPNVGFVPEPKKDGSTTVSSSIQWSMLLSHHSPCDYDHTFRVGDLHICARCTGIISGGVAFVCLLLTSLLLLRTIPLWVSLLLPIPAVIDFATHELGWWQSNNFVRWTSGVTLGFAIAWGMYTLFGSRAVQGIAMIAWLAALELTAAIILRAAGRLEQFIERYEKAVRHTVGLKGN